MNVRNACSVGTRFLLLGLLLWVPLVYAETLDAAGVDPELPKVLVISCDREFPPYTTANAENEPEGMLVDLWRLWSDKTGHKITFRVSDWGRNV